MVNYRVFLGAVLLITCFNLVLFLNQRKGHVSHILSNETFHSPSFWLNPVYTLLHHLNDDRLFVLEPHVLAQVLDSAQLTDLKWRFNLSEFKYDRSCITLAMFGPETAFLSNHSDLIQVARVQGPLPFSSTSVVQHLFYHWHQFKVHVVVLHAVKHFLWMGEIPEQQLSALSTFNVHFGKHQEIYDQFEVTQVDSVNVPSEIGHFLGQMATSKYMHCSPEKANWLREHNVKYSASREAITVQSILSIKSLMKELKMEFWVMCGTLLGWYRQCGPIPFTTDNDFSTWPKYLQETDISPMLKKAAPKHGLRLFYRFGEPKHSMEYSFKTTDKRDKVDMFFTYRNATHFLLPFHVASKHIYQYSIYPQYKLCSIELLGYKLLAPCEAELIIRTEYGPNWKLPKKDYDYATSPFNAGPVFPFPRNISQYSEY